jgi:hypothetical protein
MRFAELFQSFKTFKQFKSLKNARSETFVNRMKSLALNEEEQNYG